MNIFHFQSLVIDFGTAVVIYYLLIALGKLLLRLSRKGSGHQNLSQKVHFIFGIIAAFVAIGFRVVWLINPSILEQLYQFDAYEYYLMAAFLIGLGKLLILAISFVLRLLRPLPIFRDMSRITFTDILTVFAATLLCIYLMLGGENNLQKTNAILFTGILIIAGVVLIIIPGKRKDPQARSQKDSVADELTKLLILKEKGVLTEEEFDLQKKRLLDS